jgi:hypothetical protein
VLAHGRPRAVEVHDVAADRAVLEKKAADEVAIVHGTLW